MNRFDFMFRRIVMSTMLLISLVSVFGVSFAALPPWARNERDVTVMLDFIFQHNRVAATLEAIDVKNKTVYFDNGCKAFFKRKNNFLAWLMPMPGPEVPLVFERSTCPIDEPE